MIHSCACVYACDMRWQLHLTSSYVYSQPLRIRMRKKRWFLLQTYSMCRWWWWWWWVIITATECVFNYYEIFNMLFIIFVIRSLLHYKCIWEAIYIHAREARCHVSILTREKNSFFNSSKMLPRQNEPSGGV